MSKRFSMVMVPTAMLLMALGLLIVEGSRRSVAASEATSLSWRQVMGFFWGSAEDKGPGRTGGPRPGDYCLISPWDGQKVWSLEPMLIWRGSSIQSTGIRKAETGINPPHLLVQMVDEIRLAQASEPLQPGVTYDWTMYFREGVSEPAAQSSFEIIDGDRRMAVTAGLHALEAELAEANATLNEVAMSKAEFFSKQDLPFDALQVMFSVEEPSPELVESRQEMVERICNPPEEDEMEIDDEG